MTGNAPPRALDQARLRGLLFTVAAEAHRLDLELRRMNEAAAVVRRDMIISPLIFVLRSSKPMTLAGNFDTRPDRPGSGPGAAMNVVRLV